ncbi:MAG: 1-acyl-sn-glycerol-3-phosphate acyltransferase, partial [Anaerolineales bacterium]
MREKDQEIQVLSRYLIDEIIMAFGLKKTIGTRRVFNFLLNRVTTSLSTICVLTDRKIATDGFPAATGWMASHWVRQVTTRGSETVPSEGPLLIVSNHVGAYDILVVPSQINRRDIKIIASDTPFFKRLPNASQHMIYASDELRNRMAAARQGLAHLQGGGALLLFGTGLIDPDPAIYPYAEAEIVNWSPSIDLFLGKVPEAQVVISIVSGIVMSKWAHSPLTWLRRV